MKNEINDPIAHNLVRNLFFLQSKHNKVDLALIESWAIAKHTSEQRNEQIYIISAASKTRLVKCWRHIELHDELELLQKRLHWQQERRSRWIFDMVIVGELSYCYLAFSLTRFLSDSKLESNYQKIKRCSQLNRNSITWQLVNEQRKNGKSQKSVRFAQDEILMHFIITIWDRITASKWAWARKDSKGFANTEIT